MSAPETFVTPPIIAQPKSSRPTRRGGTISSLLPLSSYHLHILSSEVACFFYLYHQSEDTECMLELVYLCKVSKCHSVTYETPPTVTSGVHGLSGNMHKGRSEGPLRLTLL